jgi:hypothetical protein
MWGCYSNRGQTMDRFVRSAPSYTASGMSLLNVSRAFLSGLRRSSVTSACVSTAFPSRRYATARENAQGLQYLQNNNPDWTESQKTVRDAISKLCEPFGDEYWREIDKTERWPTERTLIFHLTEVRRWG